MAAGYILILAIGIIIAIAGMFKDNVYIAGGGTSIALIAFFALDREYRNDASGRKDE